ncbi:MAG TPA: nucleotide pyrophosphohydrolase [Anaerolineae bacterium]|nr:nucleotide pyrophosphohydrolase [Anaerolineae bacterium]
MTKDYTVAELTDAMNRFVGAMGWYGPDSPVQQTPRNIAISLSLEAAEVLEYFQWGETAQADALAEELADVALYLLQLAYVTQIDLGQAIMDKLAINYRRFGPASGNGTESDQKPETDN